MRVVDALGIFPLAIALCLCAQGVLSMTRQWFRGRWERVNWIEGLVALPSRYLVDVHDVVARRPRNARMHAMLAGGFLTSLVLLALSFLFPATLWVFIPIWIAAIIACFGLWLERERRTRPVSIMASRKLLLPLT